MNLDFIQKTIIQEEFFRQSELILNNKTVNYEENDVYSLDGRN